MKPWQRIEPTVVTKVGHRTIVSKTFILPDGSTTVFDVLGGEGQAYVVVVAMTPDNHIVVARQFRPGPEKIMYELPGGGIEPGEDPGTAALRELLEETGYAPEHIEILGMGHKDAYMNSTSYFFLAVSCTKVSDQELDQDEVIDVELITPTQLLDYTAAGLMTEPLAVLLAYKQLGLG